MEQEPKWKQVLEFPSFYISDGGQVINLRTGKILAPLLVGGKAYVRMWDGGKPHQRDVAKLLKKYHREV